MDLNEGSEGTIDIWRKEVKEQQVKGLEIQVFFMSEKQQRNHCGSNQ